ncbi:MgtC/SapB family protein [Cohnella zeiphila]|uniref:MgtC/SapB family protein n=1 Tax=Cohnella zeiphila TaxID=2761120 RepID=A0A7X0SPN5_9BACL|nr:MgtC/SapB family protein [Cohnella zeiphila]MBB6731553.1 MgtC/SapB family protein [Cohnella zeiphila]
MSDSVWYISHGELILRMMISAALGGAIGMEREWNHHAAGLRTHILVCLGSTTIMLLSMYGFSAFISEVSVRMDPARLAAQVISGIGFLGAGAIMRNGNIVKGLTTAASVWVVAGIGLCVGAGFLTGAFFCTFLVLISLYLLNKWEKVWGRKNRHQEVEIKMIHRPDSLARISAVFGKHGIQIADLKMKTSSRGSPDEREMTVLFYLKEVRPDQWLPVLEEITLLDIVHGMETRGGQVSPQAIAATGAPAAPNGVVDRGNAPRL